MKIIIILMQKTRFNRESFAVSLGVLKVRVCLFVCFNLVTLLFFIRVTNRRLCANSQGNPMPGFS